jgi:hypothetical protein
MFIGRGDVLEDDSDRYAVPSWEGYVTIDVDLGVLSSKQQQHFHDPSSEEVIILVLGSAAVDIDGSESQPSKFQPRSFGGGAEWAVLLRRSGSQKRASNENQ